LVAPDWEQAGCHPALGAATWGRADLPRPADRPVHLTHDHVARRADLSRLSSRAKRDAELRSEILRAFEANIRVYGVRKVWRQMQREGFDVARLARWPG
jgi:hypothetical protein